MNRCHYISKFIPSQWNKFRNIKCEDVDYGYDIKVVTQILTLKDIPEDQLKRLLLIETLYEKGLSSVQISDFLNNHQISTPTGLSYNPKLVWVTHNKFQNRKKRIKDTLVSVDQDYFYIREGVKFWTV
jgi:hypothetical protein